MRKLLLVALLGGALFTGCSDDAQVASHNLSKAADIDFRGSTTEAVQAVTPDNKD